MSDKKNRASVQIDAEVLLEKNGNGVKSPRLLAILSIGNQYLHALDRRRDMHVWKPLMDGTVMEYGDMETWL